MSDISVSSSVKLTADEIRAHELYKYFRPPIEDDSSPDQILTAHAQLVAWRLNAERSMITLIDEQTQYFVAESTKTLHLDNAHQHDHPDDAIWAGCVRVSKAGRLCEHTIAATPPESGGPACFEVVHLNEDARFNTLDFIAGPPHFKHYAGVPLRTRKGVNIGSIFIIDSRTRSPLTKSDWHFLSVVADNVIKHLEMIQDKKQSIRSLKMNACMAAYVDPLQLGEDRVEADLDDNIRVLGPLHAKTSGTNSAVDTKRLSIYKRAAGWLLQGLDYDESGGGVMFLDTLPPRSEPNAGNEENFTVRGGNDSEDGGLETSNTCIFKSGSDKEHDTQDNEILAHAIQREEGESGGESSSTLFNTLSPKDLHRLTRHYPEGKLFTFSSHHALINSSDETSRLPNSSNSTLEEKRNIQRSHANKLQRYFPRARQIVILPVWDTSVSRWVVCIAYHRSMYHHMSYKSEFVFCATFTKTLVAELSKLAVVQANQQKSDFITSISHELRSPLHGILASCDFLDDTNLTQFQQSLVGTADSCARTLLDTINMVLDYSDINRFENTRERIKQGRRDPSDENRSRALQTSVSTRRTFDIAALVEEVVDSLLAGHNFEDRPKRSDSVSTNSAHVVHSTPSTSSMVPTDDGRVSVILDIPARNWTYYSEPGALRRIVLNLVGNALKFTHRGFVHIKLDIDTPKHPNAPPRLVLTVMDSGQGISPNYLRDTLYSPFTQESNLSAGTGLGLSLVKSIVRTMGGKIRLDSSQGIGTTATVKLPLKIQPSAALDVSGDTGLVHFDTAAERQRNILITAVRVQAPVRTCALFWNAGTDGSNDSHAALRLLQTSLVTYLSRWFGLSVSLWQYGITNDIVISTVDGLKELQQLEPSLFTRDCQTAILAIETAASPVSPEVTAGFGVPFVVRSPFGPTRLAQALGSCLDTLKLGQSNRSVDQHEGGRGELSSIDMETAVVRTSCLTNGLSEDPTQQKGITNHDIQVNVLPINTKDVLRESILTKDDMEICVPAKMISGDTLSGNASLISAPSETVISETLSSVSVTSEPTSSGNTSGLLDSKPALSGSTAATAETVAPYPRMLLVDDNSINLRLLQLYCKKLGATNIHSAKNGQEAVDTYEQLLQATPSTPPGVVFMDLSMPLLNGFDATRRIRQIEEKHNMELENGATAQRSLIIALTGLASLKDQKEAFEAGVDRYLMKPAKFANLTQILVEEELKR